MAKVVLACDDTIYYHDGCYYAESKTKFDFYLRYLRVFDGIRIVVRIQEEHELRNGRVLIDDTRIDILGLPVFRGPKDYARNFFAIKKRLKNVFDGYDTAICRVPSTTAFNLCSVARRYKIPYAVEVVANPKSLINFYTSPIHKFLMRLWHFQLKKAIKDAIGVSYVTREALQKIYKPSPSAFTEYYSSLSLNTSFFLGGRVYEKKKTYKICHVCNPIKSPGKGHSEIIKMIPLLKEKGIDCEAVFVGQRTEYADYLDKLAIESGIENNIHYAGFIGVNDLLEVYKQSDIMVFFSHSEGLPRVVLEAMACGLPCVASNVGGIPELLQKSDIFDFHDVEGGATRVFEILTNKDIYENDSVRNYEESLLYRNEILQMRRDAFYNKLKERI